MKKIVSILSIILLIVFIGGVLAYGLNRSNTNTGFWKVVNEVQNKLFPKQAALSKEIVAFSDRIDSISPEDTSIQRVNLLKDIDEFTKESISGNAFTGNIYSLIQTRLNKAFEEIKKTKVEKGKVRIWYIYNMGVIAKTVDKTIGFDLAGSYVYANMSDFVKNLDVLVITHFHGDHFEPAIVKKALNSKVYVVIPNIKVSLVSDPFGVKSINKDENGENIIDLLARIYGLKSNNLIAPKPLEKTTVDGIDITAYPALHVSSADTHTDKSFALAPVSWQLVNLSGISILDTGDGETFTYQPDFVNKSIDIVLTHNYDQRINDSLYKFIPNAKTVIPLHVLELGHGVGIIDYMSYQGVLDEFSNGYLKESQGKIRFVPLIWGESLTFPKN